MPSYCYESEAHEVFIMQLFVLGFLLALQDKLVTIVSGVYSASIFMFNQSKKNVLGLVALKMEISLTFTS